MLKKSLDHLVRCANSDIGQTGSSTAVSCAPNDLLELAVETLIQGGVESVLDTVDGQLESLHPVAGAMLRNELEAVELGQPVVRVTDGLQVQAGIKSHLVWPPLAVQGVQAGVVEASSHP